MVPKKKTSDKVPAGTGDAVDSGSTPNIASGNDPTLDPSKDPSQVVSATSETNTIHPTTWSTRVTDQLAQPASEQGTSEDPTQTPTLMEEVETLPSLKLTQITLSQHMDEVKTIHNMSCQAAQLLVKTNESNSAPEARTRTLGTQLIAIREKYLTIARASRFITPVE
ncbi:hypothetical protein M422DRAFT_253963 [Sphaerobolus stellatus SS14]|uniref:Uncharacterized protein n=1 Tax=Sphaerobolus stellatus (strain SS14) TaxID=990650 RepID=A0A0C9VWW2_SPHS4|nr:hypothetical protein M422DRAFT_253963 [Sphaerobolus stellatus SS14]